jgi:pimeloyl-ACP methyl ester carboxylesterase
MRTYRGCGAVPACTTVASGSSANEVEVNGVRIAYLEQDSSEPTVFVHGAFSDLRLWEPIREEIAKRYRFIAYTLRYFGAGPWPDDGKGFSVATDFDDLVKFITSLNVGQVHLVTRSRGSVVATVAALKRWIARCVPGARQVAFPNLGHDAPSRDPAAFTRALFEFLAKQDARASSGRRPPCRLITEQRRVKDAPRSAGAHVRPRRPRP